MQHCHSLNHKHLWATITFIFNAIISLVGGANIKKRKINGKTLYIFSRSKQLRLYRVSNERENYEELEFV